MENANTTPKDTPRRSLSARFIAGTLVAGLLALVLAPGVFAKTGKFTVASWVPPKKVTVKGKEIKRNGILVVQYAVKEGKGKKAKTVTRQRIMYVPEKVANRFAKIDRGYFVRLSFTERKKAKREKFPRGDVRAMKILSSGTGDASGAEAGGAGESEAPGGGGGSGSP